MKHIYLFLLIIISCSINAQYSIPLIEEYSGNKHLTASVNGVPVDFIFDTGCSSLSINRTIFEDYLSRHFANEENYEAAQMMMSEFYKNWLVGQTKREAFRNAQNTVRAKYEEPVYWAGFIMLD